MVRGGMAAMFFTCVLALFALSGCQRSDGSGPKLAPVTGRVTFKNEAVTAATVYFIPDAEKGNRGTMASAVLETDGSFTMATAKGNEVIPGVIPGAYKIQFDLGRRPEKELAPYRDVKKTPLSVEVPEQGLINYAIELK